MVGGFLCAQDNKEKAQQEVLARCPDSVVPPCHLKQDLDSLNGGPDLPSGHGVEEGRPTSLGTVVCLLLAVAPLIFGRLACRGGCYASVVKNIIVDVFGGFYLLFGLGD